MARKSKKQKETENLIRNSMFKGFEDLYKSFKVLEVIIEGQAKAKKGKGK
jgi:hypothetical protein